MRRELEIKGCSSCPNFHTTGGFKEPQVLLLLDQIFFNFISLFWENFPEIDWWLAFGWSIPSKKSWSRHCHLACKHSLLAETVFWVCQELGRMTCT